MNDLMPNQQRAKNAINLMWALLVLTAGLTIQIIFRALFVSDTDEIDIIWLILPVLWIIVFPISSIAFLMWFNRAYSNLHQMAADLSYKKGWAIGCWFVPIMNLVIPLKIMVELYVESSKLLKKTTLT